MSILKKFFFIRTSDTSILEHKGSEENIYQFKLKKQTKAASCLNYFSIFGWIPKCTKGQRRYHRLIRNGGEKLRNYVNARSIMGILYEHHAIL